MASGTLVCMRKAISYWAMRAFDLGVAPDFGGELVQLVRAGRAAGGGDSVRDAVGIVEIKHRLLAGAELHALMLRRQETAAPEPRVERLVRLAAGVTSTTKAGRFSLSLPRP